VALALQAAQARGGLRLHQRLEQCFGLARQRMGGEEPFADQLGDLAPRQARPIEQGDATGGAAPQQRKQSLRLLQQRLAQADQHDIAVQAVALVQATAAQCPAGGLHTRQQAFALVTGVDHQ
jgi:hypothetical protein